MMGAVIAASLSIIGYISFIFVKVWQLKKQFVLENEPKEILKGRIILVYANDSYNGYAIDLSQYEKNKIIGLTCYSKNLKAKKPVDVVIMVDGDVEMYADGFCCLGEEAMQRIQTGDYWFLTEDGGIIKAGES